MQQVAAFDYARIAAEKADQGVPGGVSSEYICKGPSVGPSTVCLLHRLPSARSTVLVLSAPDGSFICFLQTASCMLQRMVGGKATGILHLLHGCKLYTFTQASAAGSVHGLPWADCPDCENLWFENLSAACRTLSLRTWPSMSTWRMNSWPSQPGM